MPQVGPSDPASVVNNSGVGTLDWTNPSYAQVEDASNATAIGSDASDIVTHYLWATQFGFSVPSSGTIKGVVASIKRKKSASGGTVHDNSLKLIKGGATSGNDKADTGTTWPTTLTWKDYGSSTDLWGNSLLPSDVNASNFGSALSAYLVMNAIPPQADVDNMHLTVYYTMPSRGPGAVFGSMQPMIFMQRRSPKLVKRLLNQPFQVRRF